MAISNDGSTALLGGIVEDSVSVIVKSEDSWTEQANLEGDGGQYNRFGGSVAISGDGSIAIVGAHSDDSSNGEDTGSVYVYERSGGSWSRVSKLIAEVDDPGGNFGNAVAISNDGSMALVGDSGAHLAYVFQ